MALRIVILGLAIVAMACADSKTPQAPNSDATTPAAAAPASGPTAGLSDFEKGIIEPLLADIRQGIVPVKDGSVGIFKTPAPDEKGKKQPLNMDGFVGLEGNELPAGEYFIGAWLNVPKAGPKGTWQVTFKQDCTTTFVGKKSKNETTNSYEPKKPYVVTHNPNKEKGYRLAPLVRIKSPTKKPGVTKACSYAITAKHPNGDDKVFEGSYKIPEPAPQEPQPKAEAPATP